MTKAITLIDIIKELVDKFNRFSVGEPIELEIKEGLATPEGVRQYIQLYGPKSEQGQMIDLTKIVLATDIEENQNEKVQNLTTYMVGLLALKMSEQTDPYVVLANAIKHYDELKTNMEIILTHFETEIPESFDESLDMWNTFQRLYDWVTVNERYVRLEDTIKLHERTPKLPRQIFQRLMDDYLNDAVSVLLIDLIPLVKE